MQIVFCDELGNRLTCGDFVSYRRSEKKYEFTDTCGVVELYYRTDERQGYVETIIPERFNDKFYPHMRAVLCVRRVE